MTNNDRWGNRYWGDKSVPKSKVEFFNAVTAPAPLGAGTGTIATIRMYGPIDSWGGFWGISTKDVGEVLDTLPESVTQIILRINSPGGEVFEGVSILNMLRAHKASVTAVVDGLAASAASVIAAGCDDTVMSPGTQMMIHSPLVFAYGNAVDLRKTAAVLDNIESSLIEIYTAKAGEKDWPTLLADDTWLNAADAVEFGLADRVAVIPDAGESETVGAEEPDDIPSEGDEPVDMAARARTTWIPGRIAAQAPQPPSSSEPGTTNQKEKLTMSDTIKAGLRERLGVTDAAASDETLLAALDEALDETAASTAAVASVPAGTTLIDQDVLAQLQANAAAGATALATQVSNRRDGIVAQALREGRITAASQEAWRANLDANEEGTVNLLASLPVNKALPVEELGNADESATAEDRTYAAIFGDTKEA